MIEIRTGKFGQYFYDNINHKELSLEEIKNELNKLEKNQIDVFYKVGERIKINNCTYMICQASSSNVIIIKVKGEDSGNRYRNPYKVENIRKITEQEMFQISGHRRESIIRIKE